MEPLPVDNVLPLFHISAPLLKVQFRLQPLFEDLLVVVVVLLCPPSLHLPQLVFYQDLYLLILVLLQLAVRANLCGSSPFT